MTFGRVREEIKKKYGKLENFPAVSGIKHCSLSRKLNGKAEFTREEIARCCELLDIPAEKIHEYFFYT